MSSHIGRRTFIVNGLYLGIPAEVIMKWTGHKDYQTMKPYIAIVDVLKTEMNKFNKNNFINSLRIYLQLNILSFEKKHKILFQI